MGCHPSSYTTRKCAGDTTSSNKNRDSYLYPFSTTIYGKQFVWNSIAAVPKETPDRLTGTTPTTPNISKLALSPTNSTNNPPRKYQEIRNTTQLDGTRTRQLLVGVVRVHWSIPCCQARLSTICRLLESSQTQRRMWWIRATSQTPQMTRWIASRRTNPQRLDAGSPVSGMYPVYSFLVYDWNRTILPLLLTQSPPVYIAFKEPYRHSSTSAPICVSISPFLSRFCVVTCIHPQTTPQWRCRGWRCPPLHLHLPSIVVALACTTSIFVYLPNLPGWACSICEGGDNKETLDFP